MRVWKTSVLYEANDGYETVKPTYINGHKVSIVSKEIKKQQITRIEMWSEEIDEEDYRPVYKGPLETNTNKQSNPIFVSKTEKEAFKRAIEHSLLLTEVPNLMYEFIPMDTRKMIRTFCVKEYPELLI